MMCHNLTISNPFLAGSFTSTNPEPLINEGLKHSRYCASDTCAARQRHRTLTTNVYLAMQHKNDKGLTLVAPALALALALAHLMLNHVIGKPTKFSKYCASDNLKLHGLL